MSRYRNEKKKKVKKKESHELVGQNKARQGKPLSPRGSKTYVVSSY